MTGTPISRMRALCIAVPQGAIAQALAVVLNAAGNELTRANVLKQATNLKDISLPILINGTALNNSPERYTPMTSLKLIRFDGTRWAPFGELLRN